jgi:hypothetical protein
MTEGLCYKSSKRRGLSKLSNEALPNMRAQSCVQTNATRIVCVETQTRNGSIYKKREECVHKNARGTKRTR